MCQWGQDLDTILSGASNMMFTFGVKNVLPEMTRELLPHISKQRQLGTKIPSQQSNILAGKIDFQESLAFLVRHFHRIIYHRVFSNSVVSNPVRTYESGKKKDAAHLFFCPPKWPFIGVPNSLGGTVIDSHFVLCFPICFGFFWNLIEKPGGHIGCTVVAFSNLGVWFSNKLWFL